MSQTVLGLLLFYGLFSDISSNSDYIASKCRIIKNDTLKRRWKKIVVANFRYYPDICLEGLRKITEDLSLDTQ
jgi:hypothetical protein